MYSTHPPQTLEALKEIITQEVEAITPDMTHTVMQNYSDRLNQGLNNGGRNLSDIKVFGDILF